MAPQPVAIYGLEVRPGKLTPAGPNFPAGYRITMAAIDPTRPEGPEDEDSEIPSKPLAVLRLLKMPLDDDEEEDSDDEEIDEEYLKALLAASPDDEEDSDEEANGGPSDPSKKKKGAAQLIAALKGEDSDEDMAESKTNGKKGKGKASDEDDEDDEEDSDDEDSPDQLEQYVLATFDGERHFQQALDISVGPNEQAWFLVDGHFSVHLTGNYVVDDDEEDDEDEDDEDEEDMYDLASDELLGGEDSDESDELDGLDDPRVMEVDSEDEEAPKLVEVKKGKNKRAAEEAEGLDDLITKDDAKLSKKQQKKLKNNKGEAVESEEPKSKADKKVQFAKNLEQGPTGSEKKGKAAVGVKVVQGVTIDDRKIGEGRAVKNGDTVGVRYIGKLENGKVFDANKKGKPFSFKAGKNQVIKGWDIGILGMTIGGERRLTIPAHLAYGSKGLPGIPANSTLQFDVKLLEIK